MPSCRVFQTLIDVKQPETAAPEEAGSPKDAVYSGSQERSIDRAKQSS